MFHVGFPLGFPEILHVNRKTPKDKCGLPDDTDLIHFQMSPGSFSAQQKYKGKALNSNSCH